MRYLLDTHVLLWWREDDPRLPSHWDERLNNFSGEHEIFFSLVSIWEISIKRSIGKLKFEGPTEDFSRSLSTEHGFRQIGLELHEIARSERLPMRHRDPFDRLLIAQAIEAGAQAVTDDRHWEGYPLTVVF